MATTVSMPSLGESVTEAIVTRWLKREGDTVSVDEPLLEVSSDKVDAEIPSPAAGILSRVIEHEDAVVAVGGPLAIISASDEVIVDGIDAAFDVLIADGLAPWLVRRTGTNVIHRLGMGQSELINDTLPDGSMRLPRLDGTSIPGLVDNRGVACWYLPEFRLVADEFDDLGFHFAAVQTDKVTDDNKPFNTAQMTFSFSRSMPADVLEIPEDAFIGAGERVEVPDLDVTAVLALPVTAQDGTTTDKILKCTVADAASGNFFVSFDLSGDDVERAYVHFTRGGAAELRIGATYSGYQKVVFPNPTFGRPPPPPQVEVDGFTFLLIGDGEHDSSAEAAAAPSVEPHLIRYFPVTARMRRTIEVGKAFNTDTYRSRFTITAGDMTRPIIDANDLSDFAVARSEFRELTTLGDVPNRYKSLLRLYFGQVSGTVIAVPAAYGIVRGAAGLAASCDAIVDPGGVTGCRFDFTFTIAPMVDPVDMARLVSDLSDIPEAAARALQVALPSGLDPRRQSTLDGFGSADAAFTGGVDPHTVRVSVEIADTDGTPATTNVNLFLHQLSARDPAPLFGNLFLRIDDLLPQPVVSHAVLNLRQTTGSDELSALISSDPTPRASAINLGPFDLVMRRFAVVDDVGVRVTSLPDHVLAAGQSVILTTDVADATSVEVSRTLSLPTPLPKARLLELVTFDTQVVQDLQHPLTINAAGVNFAADGITGIEVHFSLTALPDLPIPALFLVPAHAIDFVHVTVPVTAAVTGLESTVSLSVTTSAGNRSIAVKHDFAADPVLVVTSNTFVP